jgi:hypothetical protein
VFHQLAPERALPAGTPMRVQNGQPECEREENASQPSRELHKNIRRLRAENVFRDRPAKCSSQAFALWALHQDHEHHEQRHQNKKPGEQVDQKIHRGGEYRQNNERSKRPALKRPRFNTPSGDFGVGCFFDLIPNLVHLRKIDVAQFFAARGQFVF